MTNDGDISGAIVDEAIGWMVAARDGLSREQQLELEAWLAADPRHHAAWERLDGALSPFRVIRSQQVSGEKFVSALSQRRVSRRAILANGAGGLGAVVIGLNVVDRLSPLSGMFADYSTSTGQRRRFPLSDGSVLTLDARSEADRTLGSRGIAIRQGVAMIEVREGAEPFWIDTVGARASIAEGLFMVSRRLDRLRMICLRGNAILSIGGAAPSHIAAVSGYEIANGNARELLEKETRDVTSWLDGKLILHDRSLNDLINAFRPYRAGVLSITAEAGRIPVSGVFELDRLNDTLAALPELFKVQVVQIGNLFVRVALA